jgi:hypothetical protein
MIDATECRELAAECRQMADRAQTIRVRSILIDIANVGQISARNRAQRGKDEAQASAATATGPA